jgi:hypothetical protein
MRRRRPADADTRLNKRSETDQSQRVKVPISVFLSPMSDKVLRGVAGRERIVVIVQPLAGFDGAFRKEQHARAPANQKAR